METKRLILRKFSQRDLFDFLSMRVKRMWESMLDGNHMSKSLKALKY